MARRGFYPEDVLCLVLSMNCDRETPQISVSAALCRWRRLAVVEDSADLDSLCADLPRLA